MLVTDCVPKMYKNAEHNIDDTRSQIATAKATQSLHRKQQSAAKLRTKAAWAHARPMWLFHHVSVHGNDLSLAFFVDKILAGTHKIAAYDTSVDKNQLLSMNYSGSIGGALNVLQAKTSYAYSVSDDILTWSAFQTKTVDISFMPGSSTYLLGKKAQQETNASTTDAAASTGSNQYSNLQGALSVWDDLAKTLDKLKSKQGKVVVSQATTSVTMRDHPSNIREMAIYLENLNRELSRQVALKVQVLEIDLNQGHCI